MASTLGYLLGVIPIVGILYIILKYIIFLPLKEFIIKITKKKE
jgi:hypothetical protein